MKLILAIIQPAKLEAVKEALSKVEVLRMTIVDVQGFGHGRSVRVGDSAPRSIQLLVNRVFANAKVVVQVGRAHQLRLPDTPIREP